MTIKLLTVILPVKDRDPDILLSSVTSVLSQDVWDNWTMELLVIDDGSSIPVSKDPTMLSLLSESVRIVRNSSSVGVSGALNRGLSESSSRLVARLDAGDVMLPGRLSRQLDIMESTTVDVCSTTMLVPSPDGVLSPTGNHVSSTGGELMFRNPIPHPTVMFARYGEVPQHYPDVRFVEDWGFWVSTMLNGGSFVNLDEPLTQYEVRDESETNLSRRTPKLLSGEIVRMFTAVLGPVGTQWGHWLTSDSGYPLPQLVQAVKDAIPFESRTGFYQGLATQR